MIVYPSYEVVWNWRNYHSLSGAHPVHIRIYIPGVSRKYFPLNVPGNVTAKQWSGKEKAWIANTHPYAFEVNEQIQQNMDRLTKLNRRFIVAKKRLDMTTVFRELNLDQNPEIFNNFFSQILKDPPEAMTDGNLK